MVLEVESSGAGVGVELDVVVDRDSVVQDGHAGLAGGTAVPGLNPVLDVEGLPLKRRE